MLGVNANETDRRNPRGRYLRDWSTQVELIFYIIRDVIKTTIITPIQTAADDNNNNNNK